VLPIMVNKDEYKKYIPSYTSRNKIDCLLQVQNKVYYCCNNNYYNYFYYH